MDNNLQPNQKIVIGVVGHADPLFLGQVKQAIESIPHFRVVFLKESQGKLFIFREDTQ